jgi:uncharacterized repeat protein (TIGR03803 family)
LKPGQLVEGPDGRLYGVTERGGTSHPTAFGPGTIFRVSKQGTFETLHTFNSDNQINGVLPRALIQTAPGVFVGTTRLDGIATAPPTNVLAGAGTLFRFTVNAP